MKHEQSELKIRISQLSEGTHNYRFVSQPTQLGLDEKFQELIEIDSILDKTQRQLYLKSRISTKIRFECDRCAGECSNNLQAEYGICYVFDESPTGESPDDIRFIHLGTPYIELTDDIREALVLAVPLKLVCTDECKGLCPHCGVNRNEESCTCTEEDSDTRWDELRKLITENNN